MNPQVIEAEKAAESIKRLIQKNSELFRRLSRAPRFFTRRWKRLSRSMPKSSRRKVAVPACSPECCWNLPWRLPWLCSRGRRRARTPVEIAAAYLFYLGRNDAFVEGGQRVALAVCLVFLSENGLLKTEELDANAWGNLTREAATGILRRDEVTQKMRELLA